MSNMNVHSSKDVSFHVGYFKPGESVDNSSVKTQFKNWLAGTSFGKNILKMEPPKCLFVNDSNTGRHIATDITSARFGNFVKVDLSGNQPSKVRSYQPPPSTKNLSLEERGSGETNVSNTHGPVKNDQELKTAKKEIADGFSKEFWNRDQMTVAIYAKMVNRENSAGPPMRAFVCKFEESNPKNCEFGKLLDGIKSKIESGGLKEGQRFQVAVQAGAHWTAIDAKIINGEPHFFVMDAASVSTRAITTSIAETFPKATIYDFFQKGTKLQIDDNSCSRFTLDHLAVMSRDEDLFERLGDMTKSGGLKNEGAQGEAKEYTVPLSLLPKGALRMLQSHSGLDKIDDGMKDRISSTKKQMSEIQQALSNTVVDFEQEKIQNKTADAKKESYAAKGVELLDNMTLEQFNKIMTFRSGEGLLF